MSSARTLLFAVSAVLLAGCTGRYLPLDGQRPGPEACRAPCRQPCDGPYRLPPPGPCPPCVPCKPRCAPACPPPCAPTAAPVPAPAPEPLPDSQPVAATMGLVVQIHDVSDIVAAMPTVELVGPEGSRVEPKGDSLVYGVLQVLGAPPDDPSLAMRMQGESALVVKATPERQRAVHDALERLRQEMADSGLLEQPGDR